MKTILGREVLDTLEELVDPRWTAVLAIDIQNDFCMPGGHFERYGKNVAPMAMQRLGNANITTEPKPSFGAVGSSGRPVIARSGNVPGFVGGSSKIQCRPEGLHLCRP